MIRNTSQLTSLLSKAGGALTQPVPTFSRGVVLAHIKAANFYLILPSEGPYRMSGAIPAFDLSSQPVTGLGTVVDVPTLSVGTPVWYICQPSISQDEFSRQIPFVLIVGADNSMPAPHLGMFPRWSFIPSPEKEPPFIVNLKDPALQGLIGATGIQRPGDRGFGRPVDACDADWMAINAFRGYIRVGGEHVAISASPSCGLSLFTLTDTCVFNTGTTFIQDSPWGRLAGYPDGNKGFTLFRGFAATIGESLGSYGGFSAAVTGDANSGFQPKNKEAIPFYRISDIAGGTVQGQASFMVDRPRKNGDNTGAKDDIPTPASIEHRGYDGTVRLGARHGIAIAREPGLDFLRQRVDEAGKTLEPIDEEPLKDITSDLSGDVEKAANQYAGLMYELMRRRFAERYMKRASTDNWNVDAADAICEKLFGGAEEKSLPALGEDDPFYEFSEDMKEVDDPVVEGEKLKAATRSSYIYQSPTGAVVISDGHGAEIRLEGGNLTITAPGDIKILPGRDLAVLAPRNATVASQGRLDLVSDKKDVVIKAEGCASLTAMQGLATVESRSTTPSTLTDVESREDSPEGGGVVIRSATTAAVLGENIRIGIQANDDTSDSGRRPHGGDILIDAGEGTALLYGEHAHVTGKRTASLVVEEGSGFVTEGAAAIVAGQAVNVACQAMLLGGSGSSRIRVVCPDITTSGITAKEGKSVGKDKAAISLKGDLLVSNAIAARQVVGAQVVGNQMACLNAAGETGMKMRDPVKAVWGDAKGIESGGNGYMQTVKQLFEGVGNRISQDKLFTAAGSRVGGVYYPSSEDMHVSSRHFWVLARWQRLMKGAGKRWEPSKTKDGLNGEEGCFYPGKEAWETRSDFVRTADTSSAKAPLAPKNEGSLKSGWPVNATVS